jgi:AraC family transcriptional regulator
MGFSILNPGFRARFGPDRMGSIAKGFEMTRISPAAGKRPDQAAAAQVLLTSKGRGWQGLEAEFIRIEAGVTHVPSSSWHRLGIHFGRSVNADCHCGGKRQRRVQMHGDIDIVPMDLDGVWADDADCTFLRLRVAPELLARAAGDLGRDCDGRSLAPRFQLRDPRLEAVAWAIKAELEAPTPSDPLYAEGLGLALAARLLQANGEPQPRVMEGQSLSAARRRALLEFIDGNLGASLSLGDLAAVAGLGVSHLKTLFRNAFGLPVHQFVIRRRVERARLLLLSGDMPISEVAAETGFADQSHLTRHMRRLLGETPAAIARRRG